MYTLGKHFDFLNDYCHKGLREDSENELLLELDKVLKEYHKKYAREYRITSGTLDATKVNLKNLSDLSYGRNS